MCSWKGKIFAAALVLLYLCHPVGWDLAAPLKYFAQISVPFPGLRLKYFIAKIKGNKLLALQSVTSVSASSIPDDTDSFAEDLNKSYTENLR